MRVDLEAESFTFTEQPVGYVYRRLIDHALGECKSALLVVRPTLHLSSRAADVLMNLGTHLEQQWNGSEWPGTRLYDGSAELFRYNFDAECAEMLKQSANALYDWRQPELPEDLCLLRADGSPWLVSISHESDGYLYLTQTEMSRLATALPELVTLLRRDGAHNGPGS